VTLHWKPSPDRVDNYLVYLHTAPNQPYLPRLAAENLPDANNFESDVVVSDTESSWTFTQDDSVWHGDGLSKRKHYYYTVSAINGAGEGPRPAEIIADLTPFLK